MAGDDGLIYLSGEGILKALRIAGSILAALVLLALAVAAVVPRQYSVERSTVIARPVDEVFSYIKFLKNQNDYSTWAKIDPEAKRTYTGTDGTVGFISAWDSDHPDVGKGEQEITNIEEGKRIDMELRFLKPFESTDQAYMTTEAHDDGTTVVWGFTGRMDYPMNLMMLFMDFDGLVGKDFETGLANLKAILETQEPQP